MTDPIPVPSGATVRLQIPGPPTILAPIPAVLSVLYVPVPGPVGPDGAPGDGATVFNEIPAGVKNGINTVFSLAHTPLAGSASLYRNGLREVLGVGYTVTAAAITFSTAPLSSDVITADYLMEG